MPGEFNDNERGKDNGKPTDKHRGKASAEQASPKRTNPKMDSETLVMPIRAYYISSVKDTVEIGDPKPCKLWSDDDINKICNVAQSVIKKLFNIKAEFEIITDINVPSFNDMYFQASVGYRERHNLFNKIVKYSAKTHRSRFDPNQTHVLFVGRIYKVSQKENSSMGLTLDFTEEKRDFNLGGNKIVIGYVYQREKMPRDQAKSSCSITAEYLPAWDLLGIVLAHELGHSLHLRHIEDEPIGSIGPGALNTNLMKKDLEKGYGNLRSYKWFSPNDYKILSFQVKLARQFGLCTKRFKDTNDLASEQCNTMLHELGLKN